LVGGSGRPLPSLMLGGTGVGKSTLLNALAGTELSSASSGRRAFTSTLHIYHHTETSVSYLEGLSAPVCVSHSAPQLLDKVIIDAPDIDSTEREHHELVWRALEHVDVILYVTTWQKYRNRVITQALSRYLGSHSVLCALNQADELSAQELEEVCADVHLSLEELGLRASVVLPISALSARRAQAGAEVSDANLEGVETLSHLLREELTMSEVRSLTQLSATRRALRAVALIPQAMGWSEGFEEVLTRLADAQQRLAHQLTALTEEGQRSLNASLWEERVARSRARDEAVGGPYGLYLASQRWLSRQGDRAERPAKGDPDAQARWLDAQLSALYSLSVQFDALARRGGWRAEAHERAGQREWITPQDRERVIMELRDRLSTRELPSVKERDTLTLNVAPWATVALIGYWLLERVIEGPEPGLVSLLFGLVVIYGVCAGQERLFGHLDRKLSATLLTPGQLFEWVYDELTAYRRLKELERALHTSQAQLKELLAIGQELATLHNQLNEAMRAPEAQRSPLLDALYRSADVRR